MNGRHLAIVLMVGLAVAIAAEGRRAVALWRTATLLGSIERTTSRLGEVDGAVAGLLVEQGLRQLEAAEARSPAHAGPPMYRGSLFLVSGRPRPAIRAYQRALELEPRAEIYANLGQAWLQLARLEEAQQALETAVALGGHVQQRNLRPLFERLGRLRGPRATPPAMEPAR